MLKGFSIKSLLFTFRRRMTVIVIGLVIGTSSMLFTSNMARMLKQKEQNEVNLWSFSMKRMGDFDRNDPLVANILQRTSIPFIIVDQNLNVESYHLVPERVVKHPDLLRAEIEEMSYTNPAIELRTWNGTIYYIFYGESQLLKMLVYFPFVQLIVIAIFILFGFITFQSSRADEQNRVWIGLAKETAHQLGTPTSSLLGWIEYLRSQPVDQNAVDEMNSDLTRLMKVVDRFSKIGSETVLKPANINEVIAGSVQYFRTRTPRNVTLTYNGLAIAPEKAMVNTALFEWVIENLLKNALDAMQGVGNVDVKISSSDNKIYIDITDTGKGIAHANFKRIFEPGFTTKTRGWGLGLSLSRRIIEDYHNGRIFVAESEIDKGTRIRIVLNKID